MQEYKNSAVSRRQIRTGPGRDGGRDHLDHKSDRTGRFFFVAGAWSAYLSSGQDSKNLIRVARRVVLLVDAPAAADQSFQSSQLGHRCHAASLCRAQFRRHFHGRKFGRLVWLGTRDKGLFFVRHGKVFRWQALPPETKINCLLVLPTGILDWYRSRPVAMERKKITARGSQRPSSMCKFLSAIRDRDSNIWFGTANGLIRLSPEGVALDDGNPRTRGPVTALFEDREGNVWVGGPHGLDRLRDSAFITYSVSGLHLGKRRARVCRPDGPRLVRSRYEGGLQWLAGEKSGAVTSAGLAQDVAYSIAGGEGELWVGRQRGGLTHLRFSNGSVSARTYTQADGLAQNSVYAVYESRDGTVWAGTLSGGVSEFKDGHFTTYTTAMVCRRTRCRHCGSCERHDVVCDAERDQASSTKGSGVYFMPMMGLPRKL